MKFITPITGLCILFACFFLLTNCDKKETSYTYQAKVPVLEKMASIRKMSIQTVAAKPLATTGKIYIFNDYLFINEPNEGIHILDNSNPSSPVSLSFLKIPGNVDLAVNDGVLYADSYVDLLTFDLKNPRQPQLLNRVEDVFKSLYAYNPDGGGRTMIVTGYKDSLVTVRERNNYAPSPYFIFGGPHKHDSYMASEGSYGTGGSMARFTLASGYLYTVDQSSLNLFDVRQKGAPSFVKTVQMGWGIETIFPYKDNLFIGTSTGMYIVSISNPANPGLLSRYAHAMACDPVVVNDDYAFVTLRTGNFCGGASNVLEIVDIKDLNAPKLLHSYPMQNPHGLGIAGNMLYICEGDFGLKSFKISDIGAIDKNLVEHLKEQSSVDVIPGPKSLIVIGKDGVCQYDYRDKERINRLSCISRTIQ